MKPSIIDIEENVLDCDLKWLEEGSLAALED